jgi:tetratricopeptide (TPR) repeat protein
VLLREHLKQKPTDHAALVALIDLQLDGPAALGDLVVRCADATDAVATNPKAAHRFARVLIDRVEDQATLRKAIDALPDEQRSRSAVLYIYAISLLEDRQTDDARKILDTVIKSENAPVAARITLARLLIESKEYQQVRAILQPLEPLQLASVVSLQALALAHTDDVPQAIELLDQAIDRQEDDVESIVTKARIQRVFLDAAAAERTLLDALVTRPKAEPIYLELFDLYDSPLHRVPDRERQWVRLMWQMLRAIPDSRVARLKSAEWDLVNKKYGPAENILRHLLSEDSKDYPALDAMLEVKKCWMRLSRPTPRLRYCASWH